MKSGFKVENVVKRKEKSHRKTACRCFVNGITGKMNEQLVTIEGLLRMNQTFPSQFEETPEQKP